jgi:hypothetical protein
MTGARRGSSEQNPADSLACCGLRARLRLEQRLLRSKDGSGLWWARLSSETLEEVSSGSLGTASLRMVSEPPDLASLRSI